MPATASVAIAKSLQGIALLLRGRNVDALEGLRAAQSDASKLLGPDDPVTRLFSLNAALALETLGRNSEALAIVEQAEPLLRKAMGGDAPVYLRVKALQSHLEQAVSSEAPAPQNPNAFEPRASTSRYARIDFFS